MKYPNVYLPDKETSIFQKMWGELATLGLLPQDHSVFCPLCLLPKPAGELTLEHIIPKRALKHDPEKLKQKHFLSHRSGLTLLCRQCNELKGIYYDPIIEWIFKYPKLNSTPEHDRLGLKTRRTLAYLAAFRELGYSYILSSKNLDAIRWDFLNPPLPATMSSVHSVTGCVERTYPHSYFEGWCDTFDENGMKVHSVFSCQDDLISDTIQVRARHLTVTLPAGKRGILVPNKLNFPNVSLNLSVI